MKKVWVSLVTPFDDELKFDASAAKRYIEFLDKYDFEGFLVAGSVGEGLLLENSEIAEYIKIIRSISTKKLMCGVIDFNYARASTKLNMDCEILLVTPPIYFKPSKGAIIDYVKQIANNTDKKIMLYNNPDRVGVAFGYFKHAPKARESIISAIDFEAYDALYELENVIGIKQCYDVLTEFMEERYPKWEILTGNDEFVVYEAVNGVVSTLANIVPTIANEDWDVWKKLCISAYSLPNPIVVKMVLSELGIMKANFRAQFAPLPEFNEMDKFVVNSSLIYK